MPLWRSSTSWLLRQVSLSKKLSQGDISRQNLSYQYILRRCPVDGAFSYPNSLSVPIPAAWQRCPASPGRLKTGHPAQCPAKDQSINFSVMLPLRSEASGRVLYRHFPAHSSPEGYPPAHNIACRYSTDCLLLSPYRPPFRADYSCGSYPDRKR